TCQTEAPQRPFDEGLSNSAPDIVIPAVGSACPAGFRRSQLYFRLLRADFLDLERQYLDAVRLYLMRAKGEGRNVQYSAQRQSHPEEISFKRHHDTIPERQRQQFRGLVAAETDEVHAAGRVG